MDNKHPNVDEYYYSVISGSSTRIYNFATQQWCDLMALGFITTSYKQARLLAQQTNSKTNIHSSTEALITEGIKDISDPRYQHLFKTLSNINMSARIVNNMQEQRNIKYIGELIQLFKPEIYRTKHIGLGSCREIVTKLGKLGLQLGTPVPYWNSWLGLKKHLKRTNKQRRDNEKTK